MATETAIGKKFRDIAGTGAVIEALLFDLSVENYDFALFQLSGTFVASVLIEGTFDGVTWYTLPTLDVAATAGTSSGSARTSVGIYGFHCRTKRIRARVSAYTSGTVVLTGALCYGELPQLTTVVAGGSSTLGAVSLHLSPTTGTAATNARVKSAASNNLTSVKASAGKLMGYALHNNTASAKFFKLYNKASAPVVANDTPIATIIIPANGVVTYSNVLGKSMTTGIAYAITGAIGDTDNTNTAVDDVTGHIDYI